MKYDHDLIVIGGGAAGLVAATGGASLGAKTALIEKNKLGGDCTWYGCVPSKALLRSAHVFTQVGRLKDFGISVSGDAVYDTSRTMSHVRDIIKKISEHHPPEVFEEKGIKLLFGSPKFLNKTTIEINGKRVTSKRFIICTGSHPMVPPISGLDDLSYLTNEDIFDLEVLPKSLVVLGGGPIGVELAQALSSLGVEVTIIDMMDRILFREDVEAARVVSDSLEESGIKIYTGRKAVRAANKDDGIEITIADNRGNKESVKAEKVLVAVGRAANIDGLDLDKAGVKHSNKGIEVSDTLRTSANNIYACGDIAGPYLFTHMAEYQAVIAIGNALFPFKRKVDYRVVPWCTFTSPELAHVGLTEAEARERHKDVKVYKVDFSTNDRAITDLEEKGFVKAVCDKKGRILGAHIVGENAGELIHEYVLAMTSGSKISELSSAIHIYPTLAQTSKRTGDQYFSGMLESKWFKMFSGFMLKFLR